MEELIDIENLFIIVVYILKHANSNVYNEKPFITTANSIYSMKIKAKTK